MGDTLHISRATLDAIVTEGDWHHWREVCGLLFGTPDRITHHLSCHNVSRSPATSFEIAPAQLIAAHRAARAGGPQIVGCYHSHPEGAAAPSPRDADAAAPDGWVWLIAAGRGTGAYRAVSDGAVHGRFDPVALVVTDACA